MEDWQRAVEALSTEQIRQVLADLISEAPQARSVQVHAVIARLMQAHGLEGARDRSRAHEPFREAIEAAVAQMPGLKYVRSGY